MTLRIKSFQEYKEKYEQSVKDPEGFWGGVAESFTWRKEWSKVVDWEFDSPSVKWFLGAELNITENIFERRFLKDPNFKETIAIHWEPNEPDEKSIDISYGELFQKVCQASQMLTNLGIGRGDTVAIYMPMIPEAIVTMLACARVGAVHSVVFAGFSAQALADRVNDCQASLVVTASVVRRGEKTINIKSVVDKAAAKASCVKSVLVVNNDGNASLGKKDILWKESVPNDYSTDLPIAVSSEDSLFILYTSGSTGRPKGVLHTTGGYMVGVSYTFENVFQYKKGDVFWCTADIGWITGHSYIVYGPLLSGATIVVNEGVLSYPDASRVWSIVDKYNVNQFYTAPTAIRALQGYGDNFVKKTFRNSLSSLGTVGEPINEDAWQWYYNIVGSGKCPIVDTWWQTETGAIMLSSLAGITPSRACYATLPLPGVQPVLLDDNGNESVPDAEGVTKGNLCFKYPWPSMIRTTYGDHERCKNTYFSQFKNHYFSGDGALRDKDGNYRILGRVDDVVNVSGHRIGTAEVEDVIGEHPNIVESAVVGYSHELKGQAICAFIVAESCGITSDMATIQKDITERIKIAIGSFAKPEKVVIVAALPKTRSGKIMRRILRKICNEITSSEYMIGTIEYGDTSSLLNQDCIRLIEDAYKENI